MVERKPRIIDCRRVELDGIRYVIVRETLFEWLCREAEVREEDAESQGDNPTEGGGLDRTSLAERLARRRRACGLSQAELARRAGVRAETLNRIERGHTAPDFATVRKLVVAMNAAEQERGVQPGTPTQQKDGPISSGEEPNRAKQP